MAAWPGRTWGMLSSLPASVDDGYGASAFYSYWFSCLVTSTIAPLKLETLLKFNYRLPDTQNTSCYSERGEEPLISASQNLRFAQCDSLEILSKAI